MPDRARAASREAPVGTIRYSTCSGTVCAVEHWTPPSLKCSTRGNTRGRASGTKGRGGCEGLRLPEGRSEEHTSELQSLMRISYAVFCLKKNTRRRLMLISIQ